MEVYSSLKLLSNRCVVDLVLVTYPFLIYGEGRHEGKRLSDWDHNLFSFSVYIESKCVKPDFREADFRVAREPLRGAAWDDGPGWKPLR